MTKWEYKQVSEIFELKENYLVEWFNKEGQEGWEVLEYKQYHMERLYGSKVKIVAILKRKIEEDNIIPNKEKDVAEKPFVEKGELVVYGELDTLVNGYGSIANFEYVKDDHFVVSCWVSGIEDYKRFETTYYILPLRCLEEYMNNKNEDMYLDDYILVVKNGKIERK